MSAYEIPEAMVEAAARQLFSSWRKVGYYGRDWDHVDKWVREDWCKTARAALEAAFGECHVEVRRALIGEDEDDSWIQYIREGEDWPETEPDDCADRVQQLVIETPWEGGRGEFRRARRLDRGR